MSDTADIRLGGLVLGSGEPERLAAWYRAAFAPGAEETSAGGRPAIELGTGRVVFDGRDDLQGTAAEPGRILINLLVNDIAVVQARLTELGAEWIRPVEPLGPNALIATVKDPDGNYVQILQR